MVEHPERAERPDWAPRVCIPKGKGGVKWGLQKVPGVALGCAVTDYVGLYYVRAHYVGLGWVILFWVTLG